MDRLNRCYRTTVRLRVEPELLATIRWYFCPPGARALEIEHAFGSHVWETDDHAFPMTDVGEIDLTRRVCKSRVPGGQIGAGTVTPLEWFVTGVPADVVGPWPLGPCPGGGVPVTGSGVGGGRGVLYAPPFEMTGAGSGLGGAVATITPVSTLTGLGSGVGGGLGVLESIVPSCSLSPLAPDLLHADVSGITAGSCVEPSWPAEPLPLTTVGVCEWHSAIFPWPCFGADGQMVVKLFSQSDFVRLNFYSAATLTLVARYQAAAPWDGSLPKVLTFDTSLALLTWPSTISVVA